MSEDTPKYGRSEQLTETPQSDSIFREAGWFVGPGDEGYEHGRVKRRIRDLERENAKLQEVLYHADIVCAVLGAHGSIHARDDRVIALLDAIHRADPK